MGTTAEKPVIGIHQAIAYCLFNRFPFVPGKSRFRFRFEVDQRTFIRCISVRIPIGNREVIVRRMDVVDLNTPLLVARDTLKKYRMNADSVQNKLYFPDLDIKVQLTRSRSHVYLKWPRSSLVLFTWQELFKQYRGFLHPANDKPLNLLRLARTSKADTITMEILKDIVAHFKNCQHYGAAPIRFKTSVSNKKDFVFPDEISVDPMFVNGRVVLHVIGAATKFSSATCLDADRSSYGRSTEAVWVALMKCCCTTYTGYPNRVRSDRGSVFKIEKWKKLFESTGIETRLSGIRAHSSLGVWKAPWTITYNLEQSKNELFFRSRQ